MVLLLRRGRLIARRVVLEAVALLPALVRAADDALLGIGAVAEHDVEEVIIGSTDDVAAHGAVSSPARRFLDAQDGELGVDQAGFRARDGPFARVGMDAGVVRAQVPGWFHGPVPGCTSPDSYAVITACTRSLRSSLVSTRVT